MSLQPASVRQYATTIVYFIVSVLQLASSFLTTEASEIEEVLITAKHVAAVEFSSIYSTDNIYPEDVIHPTSFADQISLIPGVTLNGQGGSLQSYAIRGLSRWRIQTRIAGVPLFTERRAGNSASFLDSWLISRITVIKGPAASLFGNGAMGGLINIQPNWFDGLNYTSSYYSEGYKKKSAMGFGNDMVSFGVAWEKNNHTYDNKDNKLNDPSERFSAALGWLYRVSEDLESTLQLISAEGIDVGKSAIDYPSIRITTYPKESHHLLSWQLSSINNWHFRTYIHKQSLDTRVLKPSSNSETRSLSRDFGLSLLRTWSSENSSIRLGLDSDIRQGIKASEAKIDPLDSEIRFMTNLDANHRTSGIYTEVSLDYKRWNVRTGARVDYVKQKNFNAKSLVISDRNFSGFIGLIRKYDSHWQAHVQVSTAYRFPEVSERFLNGTTGRGTVIGNPTLANEKSIGYEFGAKWANGHIRFQSSLFNMRIINYIERIRISSFETTYANLNDGTIKGAEFNLGYRPEKVHLSLSGYYARGKSDINNRLSDISAPTLLLAASYKTENADWKLIYRYRFRWDNNGNSELPLDTVNNLAIRVNWKIEKSYLISFWGDNLLNDHYRRSADELSPYASQRGFGLSFSYKH